MDPTPVFSPENPPAAVVVAAAELDALVAALARRGWHVYGPVARDGAIVLERIERASDLPVGYEDRAQTELRRHQLALRDEGGRPSFGAEIREQLLGGEQRAHDTRRRAWTNRA